MLSLLAAVPVHAIAHITGGGLPGNLPRVMAPDLDAVIDGRWAIPRIFTEIAAAGRVADAEMARVFNLGVGMVVILDPGDVDEAVDALGRAGHEPFLLGRLVPGSGQVHLRPGGLLRFG
jgi:phosphoribosylformylglycinamidine cyclo-ligase